MNEKKWVKIGKTADLKKTELQSVEIEGQKIALSYRDGSFGAVSGTYLHA